MARIAPNLPGKAEDGGVTADNRRFIEAVLWMARTGAPWRDLPEGFGHRNSVFKRFRRWVIRGVFERRFTSMTGQPDVEYALIDGTIMRVHQHGTGAKGGTETQAIGRSRGGLTTKLLALFDALGNLVRFMLLPGQRHDRTGVDPLLEGIAIDGLIADQAFDNNAICKSLAEQGALALIPSKADRKTAIPHDLEMYKWLHLIENDFAKIKAYRRIAPRYDKTDASVEAMIRARSVSSVKKRST
jgi:transposase